jgi:hypothetical protein
MKTKDFSGNRARIEYTANKAPHVRTGRIVFQNDKSILFDNEEGEQVLIKRDQVKRIKTLNDGSLKTIKTMNDENFNFSFTDTDIGRGRF